MDERRHELRSALESYYRSCGFPLEQSTDDSVRARGIAGVTWIGLPVVPSDLKDERFRSRLLELADERMPKGERCPLELLPSAECIDDLRALLDELRLGDRGHVEIYSFAA